MRWLTLLIIALTTTSCVSNDTVDDVDVNPDKLWGYYEAAFHAESNALRLSAQLRLGGNGGTTVHLTAPAGMTVDDQTMQFVDGDALVVNVTGSFYLLTESTQSPAESYSFKWTRQDGSTLSLIHI